MPREGERGTSQQPPTAADLRGTAARVRRLMGELIFTEDRDRLREMAEELEARALAMDAAPDAATPG